MRYLFYYYKKDGTLIFLYSNKNIKKTIRYIGYTLKEAISKFRKDNNLQRKHIKIQKLY